MMTGMETDNVNLSDSSNDEDDSDWQQVPIKRKNPGSPNNFQRKRPHHELEPGTSNRFNCLANNEREDEETYNEVEAKPPPIFIPDVGDISKMVSNISKVIKSSDFTYKSQRDGQVRLVIKSVDSYRKVVKYLESTKKSYHTFQLKPERAYRVVIKGLHHTTPVSDIKAYLLSFGHQVRSVRNVISRVSKQPLSMFFVDIDPNSNNKEIFNIRSINNAIIEVEAPKKFDDIAQCFRCQEFGHTKSYCRKPFRCVKCGLGHPTAECTKPQTTPPKCVHCLQDHTASYKGCKIYQDLVMKRSNRGVNPHATRLNHNNNTFAPINPNNNPITYSQAIRGTEANEANILQKIEAMLTKQLELTNTLVSIMSLLMNKLCK